MCTGITICRPGDMSDRGQGTLNGIGDKLLTWQLSREFSPAGLTVGQELRRSALSIGDFEIKGDTAACKAGCVIVSDSEEQLNTSRIQVVLEITRLFELSPYQTSLWLSAYSDIVYDGVLGRFDRVEHQSARDLGLESGDFIRVEMNLGTPTAAILELIQYRGKSVWDANIYTITRLAPILNGIRLTTRSSVNLDGYTVSVERQLGHIERTEVKSLT